MNLTKLREHLRKEGWLLAALIFCAALCLILGAAESSSGDEDSRIGRVLSRMEGAGTVEVAIFREGDGPPSGVVVVAEGANDVLVRLRLTSAVATLLGIDSGSVAVYPMERK